MLIALTGRKIIDDIEVWEYLRRLTDLDPVFTRKCGGRGFLII